MTWPTATRFTQSARRHRIGQARAKQVIESVEPEVITSDGTQRLLWVGPDDTGLVLEVVAVVDVDYLLVIHVMPRHFRRSSR